MPYPPDGGAPIRTFNVMRLLARAFDITAICFHRGEARDDDAAVARNLSELGKIAEVAAFPVPQAGSRRRLLWDHARSVALRRVYTRYLYESRAFRAHLGRLLHDQDFDLVHVDSLDLSAYLPALRGLPVACTHHNVESSLLRRRARSEGSPALRAYLRFQAERMQAEESRWVGKVDLNVAVSEDDARRLIELVPDARVIVVPNGVDTSTFEPRVDEEEHGLVFAGGHSWYPNRDAMQFFGSEILPLLRRDDPGIEFTWVGRCEAAVREEYERAYGMRLTGYVEDIRPYVQSAACYVVPLRVGGGTRLKILDAWAMGKAVVSTSVGCEGLKAVDGENILIRDTPEEFSAAVREILSNRALRQRIGRAARQTALRTYDWDVIGEALIEEYAAVARAAR